MLLFHARYGATQCILYSNFEWDFGRKLFRFAVSYNCICENVLKINDCDSVVCFTDPTMRPDHKKDQFLVKMSE